MEKKDSGQWIFEVDNGENLRQRPASKGTQETTIVIHAYNLLQYTSGVSFTMLVAISLTSLLALLSTNISFLEPEILFLPLDLLVAVLCVSLYNLSQYIQSQSVKFWVKQTPPYQFQTESLLGTFWEMIRPAGLRKVEVQRVNLKRVGEVILVQFFAAMILTIIFASLLIKYGFSNEIDLATLGAPVAALSGFVMGQLAAAVVAILLTYLSTTDLVYLLTVIFIPALLMTPIAKSGVLCSKYLCHLAVVDEKGVIDGKFLAVFLVITLGAFTYNLYFLYSLVNSF